MVCKLLSVNLSVLMLCASVPLRAATQDQLVSNPEKAVRIEQEFFDGASLTNAAPMPVIPGNAIAGAFGEARGGTDPTPPSFNPPSAPRRTRQQPSSASQSHGTESYGSIAQNQGPSPCGFADKMARTHPKDCAIKQAREEGVCDLDWLNHEECNDILAENENRRARNAALKKAYDTGECDLEVITQDECNQKIK
ncbi:MAG: hypothetical protein AABZ44_09430, partial [Elusimicrobiota bacterium]